MPERLTPDAAGGIVLGMDDTFVPRVLRVLIEGRPIPQGSKRRVGRQMVESSAQLRPWRARVAHEIGMEAERTGWRLVPAGTPVRVDVTFSRPASGRPLGDIDKLCRAVCDALSRPPIGAGAIHDDGQIEQLNASMIPASPAHPLGAALVVVSLDCVPHVMAA